MLTVPFYKPCIDQAEIAAVIETLKSGWLTTGPQARQFEQEFAAYVQRRHVLALNSCTAALHLALEAIGLQAGEAVLVPTLTFAATAEVVHYLRAHPVLVDCRPQDFNLDVADAARQLEQARQRGWNVAAIIPVHFAGQIGDVEGVRQLAQQHGLKVIEDAAHCCPAFYRLGPGERWHTVGSSADLSCFSFYANKPITTGEGGMVCTERDDFAERMRILSLHGISRDAWKRFRSDGHWYYEIIAPGYKYNLSDVAAAIGLCQLRKADQFHRRRTELAELYTRKLSDVAELVLPAVQPDRIHSWHIYVVRLDLRALTIDRGQVIEALKNAGIGASVHYLPLHMHPYYRKHYGYAPEDLPCAAGFYPEMLTLPLYPDLTPEQVEYVCRQLKDIITAHRKTVSVSMA